MDSNYGYSKHYLVTTSITLFYACLQKLCAVYVSQTYEIKVIPRMTLSTVTWYSLLSMNSHNDIKEEFQGFNEDDL